MSAKLNSQISLVQQQGLTLTELMVTVAIISVLAGVAFPSFQQGIERKRLTAAVEALKADLQFARIQAFKQGQDIYLSRRSSGQAGTWCYGLNREEECDCGATPSGCGLKTVDAVTFSNLIWMQVGDANSSFNARRGTIGANGVTLGTVDYQLRVVFGNTGRVRVCVPAGASDFWEYPSC